MGIYVNPDNREFCLSVHDDIYIDKTELIKYTNSRLGKASRYLCVSRPRRFGKSMAANMLTAYYSRGCDSRALFAGLKIEKEPSYQENLNRHNVIRFDVQQFLGKDVDTFIERIQAAVLQELRTEFPDCPAPADGGSLQMALNALYLGTGEGVIFIIDEWDSPFRIAKDQQALQKEYLDFLRGLFKGAVYVDMVYMTGILSIKKYGEHSAVNMFTEFSVISPKNLSPYFGFTKDEVLEQCRKRKVDFQEMEKWYDGYLVGDTHIYNPQSVFDALVWNDLQSHWTSTETYYALQTYIERNFDGLREAVIEMLGGGRCEVDTTSFQNDMTTFQSKDDVLTLLIHLGYLTYDKAAGTVYIPNLEVREEFRRSIKNGSGWGGLMQSLNRSLELLEATWRLDGDAVADGIAKIHSEFAFGDENSLACVIYIAYYSASAYYINPIAELPTGKGRADIVYLPQKNVDRPALLVELKRDKSAESAIRQIKERRYTQWIESYTGDILLVGINYDEKTKKHSCVIEKYVKAENSGMIPG